MGEEVKSLDAQEALANVKLGSLQKQIKANAWNDNMEKLLASWGEKAAGLRFMHSKSSSTWKKFSDKLSISSIIISSVASTASFLATSFDEEESKNALLYAVGGVTLVSALIQSFKKFYNAEEKAADHISVAKQFGSFYRFMVLQMGMSREDRNSMESISNWAMTEYERLQQQAPSLTNSSILQFKNTFNNSKQSYPDIAEDSFIINIYEEPKLIKETKETKETKESKDINLIIEN